MPPAVAPADPRTPARFFAADRFVRPCLRAVRAWRHALLRLRPAARDTSRDFGSTELAEQLHNAVAAVESRFREIGEALGPLVTHGEGMIAQCEELIGLAGGQKDGVTLFHEANHRLEPALAYIDRCLEQYARQLDLMGDSEARTQRLLKGQHRLQETLAPLPCLVVLFKIEGARLSAESRSGFFTVADEIHRLHQVEQAAFLENQSLLQQAIATLQGVRSELSAEFATHRARAEAKREQITASLRALDRQLELNAQRDIHLRTMSRTLQQQVVELVTALQHGDIFRQKCEHVVSALAAGPGAAAVGPWRRLHFRQLEAVRAEFARAIDSIDSGLAEIERCASTLQDEAMVLNQFQSMTAAYDGMVQHLLEALHDVREIVHHTTALGENTLSTCQPLGRLTEKLSSDVGDMSANIHLIALNAQVRSVQLGAGNGLEVLAARTAEISRLLGDIGRATSGDIEAVRAALHRLLTDLGELREHGLAQSAHLDGPGREIEHRLHQLRDRTLAILEELGERMDGVRATASGARNRLCDLRTTLARVDDVLATLGSVVDEDHAIDPATAAALAEHARVYTTASERNIHASITGAPPPADEATSSGDFELFDAPIAPPSALEHDNNRTAGAAEP